MKADSSYDPVPLEDVHETHGPNEAGMMTHLFYAFNTIITLQAYAEPTSCEAAFAEARAACRTFERRFSRTLPHSDIALLNAAGGAPVRVGDDTANLLRAALRYCEDSEGQFDVTMGAVVRLWNFHEGVIPDEEAIQEALRHVDWRGVRVWEKPRTEGTGSGERDAGASRGGEAGAGTSDAGHSANSTSQTWAQLTDPEAFVDVGGIAKGWIADRLTSIIERYGIASFIVNLGGNVVAHGEKPDGAPWRIGLQDPRDKNSIVGAVAVRDASAVTSGVYERCFERNGTLYHHILDPATGHPVSTDAAGATVLTRQSIDAEGYSTTLLALGIERGITFARRHPAILGAYFVDYEGDVHQA